MEIPLVPVQPHSDEEPQEYSEAKQSPTPQAAAAPICTPQSLYRRRLQQVLQDHNAANAELPLRLSFGVGVAEKPTPFTLVPKEADENMYRMKRGHDVARKNHRQPER